VHISGVCFWDFVFLKGLLASNQLLFMTQEQYERTMEALDKAAARALKSREAARQFLIDAGIFLEDKPKKKPRRSLTKKKT
jgi:hypothetical protein